MAIYTARWGTAVWPNSLTTGLRAGTSLTPVGGFTTSTNDQVISALDITGVLTINHTGVTVRDCRITADSYWVIRVMSGANNFVIEWCDIIGTNGSTGAKGVQVDATGGRIQRCDIHTCEDGIYTGAGTLEILDNYIHDLAGGTDPHHDGLQINGSNTTIRGNHLDLDQPNMNSCITHGNCSDIVIDQNLLIGGAYTTRFPNDRTITNVTLTDNRYGAHVFGYGVTGGMAGTINVSGNVDHDTGANIDAQLGG